MLFNSISFLIFFPIVVSLYFSIPHKFRWALLLASSVYFYMNFIPVYILILFFLIILDYVMAILIENNQGSKRKVYLIISIISTCATLFVFKYFNFFNINITAIANLLDWNYSIAALSLALPIGLSFHTFQSLGYVIDVFKGNQKAERHLGIYALYVLFFPQLVAGPIERAKNLIHQFYEEHLFEYKRVTDGLKLMLWGFFKKVVIADRLAVMVNTIYNNPTNFTGLPLILATIFFAFQIYCDFSGYTDIARGAAKVLGFNLMENFKRPYFARSISEFWKRWHISLSSWFRDYVYIPLGGSKVSTKKWQINILIVFILSGFWHGAAWTFIIWGLLHGIYLIFEATTTPLKNRIFKFINYSKITNIIEICITFILVNIGWVFFRANSITDAVYILTHFFQGLNLNGFNITEIYVAFMLILIMEYIQLAQEHGNINHFLNSKSLIIRWSIYIIMLLMILIFGIFTSQKFIYFQF